jgi:hypothetical protein
MCRSAEPNAVNASTKRGGYRESRFQCCYRMSAEFPRQLCGSALGKPARAAVRDSRFGICKIAHWFNAPNFTASTSNEIFYRFMQPVHSFRFNNLALHGFSPNSTPGPFPRAARETRHAACPARHLPIGEFATNDLAVRPIRQLSSQRRRPREQYRRGRGERAVDFSSSDRR